MPYIGTSPSNGVRRVFDYTATAGQTSFSGSDNNSQTLAYTDSAYIDVYQNGILLLPSDYVATSGTTVVLDVAAALEDTVQIVAYDVFSVADTVSASDGGSFAGLTIHSNTSSSGTGYIMFADNDAQYAGYINYSHLTNNRNKLIKKLGSTSGKERRYLSNHKEIAKSLQKKFGNKFINICLENLPLFYQYYLFSNAKLVIAQHGASLSNVIFMKKKSCVIEIIPEDKIIEGEDTFENLSKKVKLVNKFDLTKL